MNNGISKDALFNRLDSISSIKEKRDYMFNSKLTQDLGYGNKTRWWEEYIKPYRYKALNLGGELIIESKRSSLCMQTIATY